MTDKFETYQRAIARIMNSDSIPQGTGFLVSKNHVITCAHVVIQILGLQEENFREIPQDWISIDFPNHKNTPKCKAKVIIWKPCLLYFSTKLKDARAGEDIALLEFTQPLSSEEIQPMPLIPEASPWGHRFRVYGFPTNHNNGISTKGEVLSRQGCRWLQLKVYSDLLPIEGGFSGAPLWDVEAESIIGMIVAAEKYDDKSNRAKELCYAIPTSILQPIWLKQGKLLELLQSFDKALEKVIQRAYNACRPSEWNGAHPTTLVELVSSLNDLEEYYSSQNDDSLLVKFALRLYNCQEISNLQRLHLQNWVEEAFGIKLEEFAQRCDRAADSQATEKTPNPSCSLLVAIEASEVRDRYQIRAWLGKNLAPDSSPLVGDYTELLEERADYSASSLATQMPQALSGLLDRVLEDLQSDLFIEIFLPFELLYLAPDTWEYEMDYDIAKPIGYHYPVVLRVWERLGYKKRYKSAFKWRERWDRIAKYSSQCCSSVLVCGDRADDEIGMDWAQVVAIGVRTRKVPPQGKGGFFSFLMTEGVPIALWCRQDIETCCDREKYDQLLQDCLSQLPQKLTIHRKAPRDRDRDRVGHHLSLLWDNPNRIPPDAPLLDNKQL